MSVPEYQDVLKTFILGGIIIFIAGLGALYIASQLIT